MEDHNKVQHGSLRRTCKLNFSKFQYFAGKNTNILFINEVIAVLSLLDLVTLRNYSIISIYNE